MANDKYITVLSNYDMDLFPQNKNNHFRNRMISDIPAGDGSQIALIECSYQHDFRLRPRKNCSFVIFDFLEGEEKNYGKYTEVQLQEDSVNNSLDLALLLNDYIYKHVPRLKEKRRTIFSVGQNHHIWMDFLPSDYITIILKGSLLPLIGALDKYVPHGAIVIGRTKLKDHYEYEGKDRKFSPECSQRKWVSQCEKTDFFAHRPHIDLIQDFLVLSNLVKPSNVASSLTSLMRVVTVEPGTAGNRVVANFGACPAYQNLSVSNINCVEVRLVSFQGEPIPVTGHVRCLFHVRSPPK